MIMLSLTATSLFADEMRVYKYRKAPCAPEPTECISCEQNDFKEPPPSPNMPVPVYPDKVIVKNTRGIILVGDPAAVEIKGYKNFSGIGTVELDIPGCLEELEECLEPLFIGKPMTKNSLVELKRQIILYYRKHNRPVVTVQIPKQNVTHGTFQLLVTEACLGEFIPLCNEWFSDRLILSNMNLRSGEPINSDTLLNDVAWLNTNPFRKTDIVFTPGSCEGTTDIELITKDRIPLRVYAGTDNTGTLITGLERFFVGATWANVFGLDHRLTYQATSGSDFHKYFSNTVNYIAPLSWHHNLIFWGGYSTFHANLSRVDTDIGKFKDDGHNAQISGRYEIPIGSLYKGILKNFVFGFDFKNMNSVLNFVSAIATTPIISKELNIGQFMAGFDWGHETCRHKLVFDAEVYYSPCRLFGHQSKSDFEDLRPGAGPQYIYGKIAFSDLWNFGRGWKFLQDYRFQLSSGALIPSEQFGLGGYDTVRGYEERIYNADNAMVLNYEIHSPDLSVGKWFGNRCLGDKLYFLAFLDYALGRNYDTQPGQVKTDWLMGIGPGLRYMILPYLNARVDWGYKVHKTHINEGDRSRWHFSVIASY